MSTVEHRWISVTMETRHRISLTCACGLVWQNLPLPVGSTAKLVRCPDAD